MPQPSASEPHVTPWEAQVLGTQGLAEHFAGVPPQFGVVPLHWPQLIVAPQPSARSPHCVPVPAQVLGVQSQ
jgi:hypothetical protein